MPPEGPKVADLSVGLARALAPHGLNLVGACTVDAYDAVVPATHALARLAPEARSAIVIGNGGRSLWEAVRRACSADSGLAGAPDPIDAFTRRVVEAEVRPLLDGVSVRLLYPFRYPADPIAFMTLAECAGLGRRSLVGVLVHPVFGPWIALRAAILLPFAVTAERPADGFDPCPGCAERACIAACPAGAIGPSGWDVPRCASSRLGESDACAARCHARFDCVLGREHRYPPDALAYHQWRAGPALAAFAGRRGD